VTAARPRPGVPGEPPAGPGGGQAAGPGAKGALLLVAAVVLGVLVLKAFDTGIGAGDARVSSGTTKPVATSTTRRAGASVPVASTSTTLKARAHGEVRVVVANGAGVRGLGGRTTDALKSLGYNTLAATDTTQSLDKTQVQFADGFEAEAREVAQVLSLPLTSVQRLNSPPVAAADLGDAKVVVLLGADVSTTTTGASASSTTSTTRR
jgi:hypothetical protein